MRHLCAISCKHKGRRIPISFVGSRSRCTDVALPDLALESCRGAVKQHLVSGKRMILAKSNGHIAGPANACSNKLSLIIEIMLCACVPVVL